MSRSQRSKRLRHEPPDVGVYAAIVIQFLQRMPDQNWPPSEVIKHVALSDRSAWIGMQNLLRLGLITRSSGDSMLRFRLTPSGRRYQRPRRR